MYFHRRCLRTSDAPKPFPGPHAKDWIHGTKYLAIMRAAIEQEYLAHRMPSNLAVAFVHEIMEINPAKKSHVRAQLEKRRSNCEKKAQAAIRSRMRVWFDEKDAVENVEGKDRRS